MFDFYGVSSPGCKSGVSRSASIVKFITGIVRKHDLFTSQASLPKAGPSGPEACSNEWLRLWCDEGLVERWGRPGRGGVGAGGGASLAVCCFRGGMYWSEGGEPP